MNSIGENCSVGTLYANRIVSNEIPTATTHTYGTYASPLSASSLQQYIVGINRYIFYVNVPSGTTSLDPLIALQLGGANVLSGDVSVNAYVNEVSGSAASTATIRPIYGFPNSGDTDIRLSIAFSSATGSASIWKVVMEVYLD